MLTQISEGQQPKLLSRYETLTDEKLEAIEDLADQTLSNTIKSSALPLVCGIGVGAGVAALSGTPILGAIAGSYFIYTAISSAVQKGKEAEYLKTQGLLAHSLPESQLIRYAEIIGPAAVADEIQQAYRDGEHITPAARKFLIAMGRKPQRRTITAFMDELKKLDLLEDLSTETAETPQTAYFDAQTGEGSCLLDVVLKSPGISRLMIGGQRTGKSYFAAVASREMANQDWKVFHVNLASVGSKPGDEDGYYWQHATRSVVGDLATITDEEEAKALINQAIDCLNEFWAEEKAVFIADEVTYAGSKFGRWEKQASEFLSLLAGRISALTSSGMKREKAIWALCPELVAGALKGPAKAIKSLDLTFFAIPPERQITWKDQVVTFNTSLYSQVSANFDISMPTDEQTALCKAHNIDRICFIQNEWVPIGTLPELKPQIIPNSPNSLLRLWGASTPTELFTRAFTAAFTPSNPAQELIEEIPDQSKREAIDIAYQWAQKRLEAGEEPTRSAFINRAKNERNSEYLRENRDEIWEELQALL